MTIFQYLPILKKNREDYLKDTKTFVCINDSWNVDLKSPNIKAMVLDTETLHSFLRKKKDFVDIKDIIELSLIILKNNGLRVYKAIYGFIIQEFWEDKNYLYSPNWQCKDKKKNIWERIKNFGKLKYKKWRLFLKSGQLVLHTWEDTLKQLGRIIQYYGVNLICAYNDKFDLQAIYQTSNLIQEKYYPQRESNYYYCGNFWEVPKVDILKMVEEWLKVPENTLIFTKWCDEHNLRRPNGNYPMTAEIWCQFALRDTDFVSLIKELDSTNWSETHIALEDVDCESIVYQYLILTYPNEHFYVPMCVHGHAGRANKIIKENISNN